MDFLSWMGPFALMPAERPWGISAHWWSQTVLQEISVVQPTELIMVHGLNELSYHKTAQTAWEKTLTRINKHTVRHLLHHNHVHQWNDLKPMTTWKRCQPGRQPPDISQSGPLINIQSWLIWRFIGLPIRSAISALVMTSTSMSFSRSRPRSWCRDRSLRSWLLSASNFDTCVLNVMISSAILLMAER